MSSEDEHKLAAGLAKIGLVIRHEAWRDSGGAGLTPTQSMVLSVVEGSGRGWLSVGEVARGLAVTQPTASDAVAALERKGLVARERSEEDRRVVRVRLTASGRERAGEGGNGPEVLLRAIGELDEVERGVFVRGLMKMIRSLQEAGRIPTSRMCAGCTYFRPNAHAGTARPHHCAFMDAPMRDSDLRLECAEHEAVAAGGASGLWRAFVEGRPIESRSDRSGRSGQGAEGRGVSTERAPGRQGKGDIDR